MFDLDLLFQKASLIPVIIQDGGTREVLMLGFTNREAVELTLKTGTAWFWSRSREKLWNKGETSGNFLHVERVLTDCDTDTLLYLCRPDGPSRCPGARAGGDSLPRAGAQRGHGVPDYFTSASASMVPSSLTCGPSPAPGWPPSCW